MPYTCPMSEFYTGQSRFTDPGTMASWLDTVPPDLASLRDTASGLVFHYLANGDITQHGFAPDRRAEINLRYADAMFARLHDLDPTPPGHERLPTDRIVGCCRDTTLLFVALARHHGIPARARVGFATYLLPGWALDHVIAEVWVGERWRLVEPQFSSDYVDPADGATLDLLDLLDVPRDRFLVGADAWRDCRSGARDASRFAVWPENPLPFLRGLPYVAHNLVFDLAALNKDEMILWDLWGPLGTETTPDAARMDTLAAAVADARPDRILAAYTGELRVPGTVVSVTPPEHRPETVILRAA